MTSDLTNIIEIKWTDLILFFISDYYDGPIEGLAYYKGELVRFRCDQETLFNKQRLYLIEKLSEQELVYELKEKKDFEENVGTHWSFDKDGNPLPRVIKASELQKRYYSNKQRKPNFSSAKIIAWTMY